MTMFKRSNGRVAGWRLPFDGLLMVVLLVLAGAGCRAKSAPVPVPGPKEALSAPVPVLGPKEALSAPVPVPGPKEALSVLDKRLMALPDTDPWKSCFRLRSQLLVEDLNANQISKDNAFQAIQAITDDVVWREQGRVPLKADSSYIMGYCSAIDDSFQPYALHVPKEHDGSTPLPLVVFMHGQGMYNSRQYYAPGLKGCYVVGPQGRGGMDWMFIAENDITEVVAHIQKILPIDKTRIILAGGSMGGTGSWHLATRFPTRFAGFIAINGLMDVRALDAMGAPRLPQLPADSPVRFLIEDTSSYTYACNLHNVRIFAGHGTHDPINPVVGAEAMQERLRELDHPEFEMHQYPWLRHGLDLDYEALAVKMTEKPAKPVWKLHHKTAWLRYGDAGWLCITGMERHLQHAEITAAADPASHGISVTTSKVTRLELRGAQLPFSEAPPAIVIDGVCFPGSALGSAWPRTCVFARDSLAGWRLVPASETQTGLNKNAELEGPAENAYVSRFLVVAPDQAALDRKDPEAIAAQAAADRFQVLWQKLFGVSCRMTSADKVTEADIADSNLILYGGAGINALTARILPGLPVALDGRKITLCGNSFEGEELGVRLSYPNPLNAKHYAVLNLGTCPEAYYRINERFGHWFHWVPFFHREFYDYAVFDARTIGPDAATFQAWGYFDERWQFDPKRCFAGDAKLRQSVIPFRAPMQPPPTTIDPGTTLSLVDLIPDLEITLKGCIERNRTPAGGPMLINSEAYKTGICATAPFEIAWNSTGFTTASFIVGPQWNGTENATIIALIDGKEIWRRYFGCASPSEKVTLDIPNGKRFTIMGVGPNPWSGATMVVGNPELKK